MLAIPLQAVPSQTLRVTLNGQLCQIYVYQKFFGLFVDLYVNNVLIIGSVLALNGVLIVRSQYLGFSGDLAFIDTQGGSCPYYSGVGGRYQLVYYYPSDLSQ